MNELLEVAVRAYDSHGRVPGTDELLGGFSDTREHSREVEVADDRVCSPDEIAQPLLRLHHLMSAFEQLTQKQVELEPASLRKLEVH
ncbi:MAG: hypothetical protein ACXWXC_01890 [Aeromicrobium sp.]